MPHLTLEYSANIAQAVDFTGLFSELHQVLADLGDVDIENCKSRAIRLDEYHIARGESDRAFIHLEVGILEGRAPSVKQSVGRKLVERLGECYQQAREAWDLQITVEVKDLPKAFYFKLPALKGG